jgi:hypothetical protein
MCRLIRFGLGLALAFGLATSARAAAVVHTTAASFNAAATGLTTVNLDAAPNAAAPFTVGAVTFQDPLGASNSVFLTGAAYSTGKSVQTSTAGGPLLRMNFAVAISALSFDIFDLGTVGSTTLSFTLNNGDAGVLANNFSSGTSGNLLFRGITTTSTFTSITLSNTAQGDYIEFDNIRYGQSTTAVVPEPGTIAGAASGLIVLGLMARRRRRHASA